MGSELSVKQCSQLTTDELAAVRSLSLAVYPAAQNADWPGRHLEWAKPEWCVRVLDDHGGLVTYAGMLLRRAKLNQADVCIGGIGGVMTHPSARGRGYARAALEQAIDFFRDQPSVDFGMLVCEPRLLEYYRSLGWREFTGELLIRQRGELSRFTFNRVMTLAVRIAAPAIGSIDLEGPPW